MRKLLTVVDIRLRTSFYCILLDRWSIDVFVRAPDDRLLKDEKGIHCKLLKKKMRGPCISKVLVS